MFLSILLLITIIIDTATADIDIVKSSTLPLLFAINSEEKATLECRVANGEPLLEKDNRQLMPAGVGGMLHEKDGKWVLV